MMYHEAYQPATPDDVAEQELPGDVDLEAVHKIDQNMPVADPLAPVGSNKNPIRIIQQGNQFINTQDVPNDNLQQIIQVLGNPALIQGKGEGQVLAIYNRHTNKRIVFRVTQGRRRHGAGASSEARSGHAASAAAALAQPAVATLPEAEPEPVRKRRGRRPGQKKKTPDEEDPDFEPDLPEEEVLPFPIVRPKNIMPARTVSNGKAPAMGRVSKPPKYLIKDYKHLRIEDLKSTANDDDSTTTTSSRTQQHHPDAVESEEDSAAGYSNYDEVNSDGDETAKPGPAPCFDCHACGKSFNTRAGLSRHKMLKHDPSGRVRRVGAWSDPVAAALRRRNRLKESLEKATPEDLVEMAAPRVAQVMPLYDYLFLRTEQQQGRNEPHSSTSNSPLPPPPFLGDLVAEYLKLVSRFRDLVSQNLEKVENGDADAVLSGRPAPASVKRRRLLQNSEDVKGNHSAALIDQSPPCPPPQCIAAEATTATNASVPSEPAASSLPPDSSAAVAATAPEASFRPASTTPCSADDHHPYSTNDARNSDVHVRTRNESTALGLPVGYYRVQVEAIPSDFLPPRYRPTVLSPTTSTSPQAKATTTPPKRALITAGDGKTTLLLCSPPPPATLVEPIPTSEPGNSTSLTASTTHAPDSTATTAAAAVVGRNELPTIAEVYGDASSLYLLPEGLGYPVPDEWITSGAFVPILIESSSDGVASNSGDWSELAIEAASGRVFHRPTGQLVSVVVEDPSATAKPTTTPTASAVKDDDRQQQSEAANSLSSSSVAQDLPINTITNLSATSCLVITASGARFQVEHTGEGISQETLQAILQMEGSS